MTTRECKDVAFRCGVFVFDSGGAGTGEPHEGVDDGAAEGDDRGEEECVDVA